MKKHWIIAYRQYCSWFATVPFADKSTAQKHAKQHLESDEIRRIDTGDVLAKNSREHIKDITYLEVELPE